MPSLKTFIAISQPVKIGQVTGNLFCGADQQPELGETARVRHAREKKNYWGHITEVYSVMGDTRVDVMIDRKGIEHDN